MENKRRGQPTQFRGVKSLGNGKYRLRVYAVDLRRGREVEHVKTVTASSAQEAHRLKEEFLLSVKKQVDDQADLHLSMRFGDVADRWWTEISTRKLEEDP